MSLSPLYLFHFIVLYLLIYFQAALQVVGSIGYQSNLVNFTSQASLSCLSLSVVLFLGSVHVWVHCLISIILSILGYWVSRVRCLCFCLNHRLSSLRFLAQFLMHDLCTISI